MYKSLSIPQQLRLKQQGWTDPRDTGEDWKTRWERERQAQLKTFSVPQSQQVSPDDSADTDTYIAAMQNTPGPQLDALRNDPDMMQMAQGLGVGVDDMLLFREMMLDRFASRYNLGSTQQQSTTQPSTDQDQQT